MRLTSIGLKLTALLSLFTIGCYLWSFSTFFSDNYQSTELLKPLLRYTGNLLPIFIISIIGLVAYIKRDFRWLIFVILLETLAIFSRVAAAWVLRWEVASWELIKEQFLINRWALWFFLPIAAVTFFIGCHERYGHRLIDTNRYFRWVTYLLVISTLSVFLLLQYAVYSWGPMMYATTTTFIKQLDIVFINFLPTMFFSFVALFAAYSRYYYPLILHVIFAPHYLFYSYTAAVPQIISSLDETDILALSSMYLSIAKVSMFTLAIIVFFLSAFFDYRNYLIKQRA